MIDIDDMKLPKTTLPASICNRHSYRTENRELPSINFIIEGLVSVILQVVESSRESQSNSADR